ncbi:MAG TPA: nuclear transport factor 2 family protein [Candidatus Thermoplasmatota archaeon]|nr:nuclear transport factor 2 family protein [Candidatus Thermoplasmatota archaeon]
MDLEAKTRDYFAAMDDVQVERILALFDDRGQYEVRGTVGPVGKDGYGRYLQTVKDRVKRIAFTIDELTIKRNIVFVQWHSVGESKDGAPFEYQGVHVLAWNQKGLVTHVTSLIEPTTLQRLVGGGSF